MRDDDVSVLETFFGGWFHQDWTIEAASPAEVVLQFRREMPKECEKAAAALRRMAMMQVSDRELERMLYEVYGCFYQPSLEGKEARRWLNEVADVLAAPVTE